MQNKAPTLIMTTAALLCITLYAAYTISRAQPATLTIPAGAHEDQPSLGQADAPLTFYLFDNYACTHCRAFEETVMPQLERGYLSTGRVKLVTITLPSSEKATTAAMAGLCAYKQDEPSYWRYKTLIYGAQGSSDWATPDSLVALAQTLPNLDTRELRACIDDARYINDLERNHQLAEAAGVTKTPTVVIDNQGFVGTRYGPIQKALEGQLR